ncbi:MAG: SBBP repeat-containing protein [Thermoanaerobaculia bacterium]
MKAPTVFCLALFLSIPGAVPAGAAEQPADLRFSTYLGGQDVDQGNFVAVAPSGSVFVAGLTGPRPFYPYGWSGSFLTGFAPDGSLLFSTGFSGGGDVSRVISGIAVSKGRVVVGWTDSEPMNYPGGAVASVSEGGGPVIEGWPQIDAWASEIHGVGAGPGGVWVCGRYWSEAEYGIATGNFLALLDPQTLATLKTVYFDDAETDMWSLTFDEVAGDAAGNIYVMANVQWSSYVLMKLSPDGRRILYEVSLEKPGGGGYDSASLAVDAAGRASLAWTTKTPDLPLTAPVQAGFGGGHDAFVVTLDPAGKVLLATYLGGAGDEVAGGVAFDRTGGLYLAGTTWSADFPVTRPLARPCTGDPKCGVSDAFLVHLGPPGSGMFESTLLGGSDGERGGDIALAPVGVAAVGGTASSDFPVVNAFQASLQGGVDAFVTSLTVFNHPPDCSAATASPSTLWPPDRRQVRISTLGVTDPDGDPVTLKVTRILQDELFTARLPDAGSLGTAKPWVRADRMDNGDGRVYHLFFEATDPAGAACTGEVKVCVPIQSGGTCRDGGARFDSTLPR